MKKEFIALIVSVLIYSLSGFAYMQTTYAAKDSLSLIMNALDRIESKIDSHLTRK